MSSTPAPAAPGHAPHKAFWLWVMCLTGVDYFSTLGYQPSIAFDNAGVLAPLATIVLVAVTLFGALPIYSYVARESPHGQGSIAMLEHLLFGWWGKSIVLVLLGFAATDFVITKTLSAADAAEHIIHNSLWIEHAPPELTGEQAQIYITMGLLVLLGAMFMRGFREVIYIAVGLVGIYLLLNVIIIFSGIFYVLHYEPQLIHAWWDNVVSGDWHVEHVPLYDLSQPLTSRVPPTLGMIAAVCLLIFPKLALGLSGFETGVAVMPLVEGDSDDDPHRPAGRIRNTRKLLLTAALIMSVMLLGSSFVVSTLIDPDDLHHPRHKTTLEECPTCGELVPGKQLMTEAARLADQPGRAANRALAFLAHHEDQSRVINPLFGPLFGTIYDISTVLILWFAGASAMSGLLNLVPQYLPRYGMAPTWAKAIRPLVLLFTAINLFVTWMFSASVEQQGGAYATGVLVLMSSASTASVIDIYRKRQGLWILRVPWILLLVTGVFIYTTIAVMIEKPDGLRIASFFILAIIASSLVSRIMRSTELRLTHFDFVNQESKFLWDSLKHIEIPVLVPHRPGRRDLIDKEEDIRRVHRLEPGVPIVYIEAIPGDVSEFSFTPLMEVISEEGRFIIRVTRAASVAHVIAAVGLEIGKGGHPPEIHFGWSDEMPLAANLKFVLFGEGNIPWMVRELIVKAQPDPKFQPRIVIGCAAALANASGFHGERHSMKQAMLGLFAMAAGMSWTQVAFAQETTGRDSIRAGYEMLVERLRGAIEHELEAKQLPAFSIALVEAEHVIWAAGFGHQDAARQTSATADTIYRVGSVSKLFTDIAVMQLVERGELDLDAPVTKYLPGFAPHNSYERSITLRQLMSHRSGLVRESPVGNYFDPEEPTLAATVASLNGTTLVYPPGTKTKYSNAGIAVVGRVLEQKSGVPFDKQIETAVFKPLGMKQCGFFHTPEIDRQLAMGWMWTYDGRRFEAPTFALGTSPAGNLYASVQDLAKLLSAIFAEGRGSEGAILKPETLRQMMSPPGDGAAEFGIGFHLQQLDGEKKIGHGGAVYGFSTQLEALPERKLGVAAVAALDGANGVVTRITDYALRLLLAHQAGKPLPQYELTGPVPTERAAQVAGRYRSGEQTVELETRAGRLFYRPGDFRFELRALGGALVVDDVLGYSARIRPLADGIEVNGVRYVPIDNPVSDAPPQRWSGLIGEYGWDHNTLYILEDRGRLWALIEWFYYYPLTEISENEFAFPAEAGLYHGEKLRFKRDVDGQATQVVAAEVLFKRREIGTKSGETFKIKPVKPIDELRAAALAASPPEEEGDFRAAELVEPAKLDPTIKLDIRYASDNNFTGATFYRQSRAFMQRPAAEALVRVHQRLKDQGLGLLIHDAYRPWHVTKMFWEATPLELRRFVANPASGSRHNRGCAVDLTLYDRASGAPIEMVAGYDEMSVRSYPAYPGGTSRQRWHRELLRRAMEAEGFSVYEFEWWHFDFRDWQQYRIGNATFEQLEAQGN